MIKSTRTDSAFTLVELSVVLVIVGLLVGGVMVGQSLIRTSELQAVASDLSRYENAIRLFRSKYNAMPGDMNDATDFWGAASSCPGGTGTGTQTCNGNGDGLLGDVVSDNFTEGTRAWQHLANAGVIQGRYTGVPNAGNPRITLGVNAPISRIPQAGYSIVSACYSLPGLYDNGVPKTGTGQCWGTQSSAAAAIYFGSITDVTRGATVLTPGEAYAIDQKLDDIRPDAGKIQSGTSTGCYTSNTSPSAYNVTNDKKVCNLANIVIRTPNYDY